MGLKAVLLVFEWGIRPRPRPDIKLLLNDDLHVTIITRNLPYEYAHSQALL